MVPEHEGSVPATPALTDSVLPQLSVTIGGVGATAAIGHATIDPPAVGIVTTGGDIV